MFFQDVYKRLPCLAHRQLILSVHIVGTELDLYHYPEDPVHASGFLGQDTDFIWQDTMA
jgi:hypothetical protein